MTDERDEGRDASDGRDGRDERDGRGAGGAGGERGEREELLGIAASLRGQLGRLQRHGVRGIPAPAGWTGHGAAPVPGAARPLAGPAGGGGGGGGGGPGDRSPRAPAQAGTARGPLAGVASRWLGGADAPAPHPAASASTATAPVAGAAPDPPAQPPPAEGGTWGAPALAAIRADLGDCLRCKLHAGRKHIVFGTGSPEAVIMFIGEAPGANEDLQGEPFVGEAGHLLDRMIAAMGWARGDVYIANCVKCRPPGNRNPERDEIGACEPFLRRQIAAIRPRMLVGLGKFAAQFLTGRPDAAISALRGRFFEYSGVKVMPTYHPAYLLRTPSAKRAVWDDLQQVMAELRRLGVVPPQA